MSAMLLCHNRSVKNPYFVEDLGIHLYSGEELSYYIYHNALLIGDDFLEERLFRFIGQELGMEGLEAKLRRWVSQAALSELLLVILQDIHYYNSGELAEFRTVMEELDQLSAGEKMKKRGEYLLEHQRYNSAILQYDRLMNSCLPEMEEAAFRSRIYLGCGVCYARQFLWQRAADCFGEAWNCRPSEHTAKMLYRIACQDSHVTVSEDPFREISPETLQHWKEEFETVRARSRFTGKGREVSEWMDKDNVKRSAGLLKLTEEWKQEYRRNQGG